MDVQFTNINAENVRVPDEMLSVNTKHEEKSLERAVPQEDPLNKQEVKILTEKIQDSLDRMNINLNFSTYGENDERTAVTVTEKESGKEIREIPSEELQQLYLKMNELTGILFNHTV
ncbi:MAG: hypothetical protein DRH26_00255 [Deltaproteobacteria bacterium]|nr:MAG: hypothetical protein DRH26_00255 [Deltaproteobacteria bacterium]